jgi:hypothetical protein
MTAKPAEQTNVTVMEHEIARRVFDLTGAVDFLVEKWRSPQASRFIENEAGDIEHCARQLQWLTECIQGSFKEDEDADAA